MRLRIGQLKEEKRFGGHAVRIRESQVFVTDTEKTIIDCLDRLELSGGVARALEEEDGKKDWKRATGHLGRVRSGALVRGPGFFD